MVASKDYDLHWYLVNLYVKSEDKNKKVRAIIFYEDVIAKVSYYRVPEGETESHPMKQLRARYESGKGDEGEATKFYQYFYQKFREDIKKERESLTGNPYSQNKRYYNGKWQG